MPDLLRLTDRRPDTEIKTLVDAVIADAKATWNEPYDGEYPKSGFGLGRLRPLDITGGGTPGTTTGVSYVTSKYFWALSVQTAGTWQDWFDITTSETAYLIITGVFCLDATPNITEIRPYVDGDDFPVINVEEMYSWDIARAYFSKPFAVKPQKKLKMRVVGKTAGQANFGLIGFVVGKRSYLIGE